jgi:hypothetical protein
MANSVMARVIENHSERDHQAEDDGDDDENRFHFPCR